MVGFRIVGTAVHTPGHAVYWREASGLLISGDVLFNTYPLTKRTGLNEPPSLFT